MSSLDYPLALHNPRLKGYMILEGVAHQPVKYFIKKYEITYANWQNLARKRIVSVVRLKGKYLTALCPELEDISIRELKSYL